ncbi:hypothetical protein V9L05_21555 (plasmid) [Bernardetia sp. Wsw4-3y2]
MKLLEENFTGNEKNIATNFERKKTIILLNTFSLNILIELIT